MSIDLSGRDLEIHECRNQCSDGEARVLIRNQINEMKLVRFIWEFDRSDEALSCENLKFFILKIELNDATEFNLRSDGVNSILLHALFLF